jgi:squalene cyclase
MLTEATELLLQSQNPDGGWGAVRGKRSATETTALAYLALHSREQSNLKEPLERSERWLTEHQNADGSWPLADGLKSPSWSTAIAMLALNASLNSRERLAKAGLWSLEQKGSRLGILAKIVLALSPNKVVDLDHDLVGWSWAPNSSSWVEPTSYFITALKKTRHYLSVDAYQQRVSQGELLIYDRMCENGGWNYGNSVVYGERLWPYPDVTAVALIALQDRRERRENQHSLRALGEMTNDAASGLALSWTAICYELYGQDTVPIRRLIEERFKKTRFLGEAKVLALAVLAMGNGARYFRV